MKWLQFLCFVSLVDIVPSINVYELQNFGIDFGDRSLKHEDDQSSDEIVLREPFIFYGKTYFSVFVNSNGLISFLTEIPYFYNSQFPLDYPAIAPLYSDVDLSNGGNVWYRETSDPVTLSWAQELITPHFSAAQGFQAASVFLATWEDVPPYGGDISKNTFQVALVTNSADSYVIFQYIDGGLQWLQGGGKTSGLPDAMAQAGFISESKMLYNLKGSGTDQVRNLAKWSNIGEAGIWIFRVGKILPGENVQSPDMEDGEAIDPEDSDSSEEDQYESCATGGSICHSLGTCIDYEDGFCCECDSEYYGNGKNCLRKDTPIRVTGKVNGNINGIDIKNADLHSYVLSNEGRTYTAISRIDKTVGYDLQSLIAVGEGIAWLFAVPMDGIKNGFISTGGSLNRSVEIEFPQTGHKAIVHQTFNGLDVFNNVAVDTTVSGAIPSVPIGSEIEVDSFREEITKVERGSLRASSKRSFRLKGETLTTPFSVETFIDFDECPNAPLNPEQATLRLKIADNIFIRYDEAESIVRYSFSAKIGTLEEVDPCLEGKEKCGPNSQCVVDGDEHRCVCEQGYSGVFDTLLNIGLCLDINECETSRDRCDRNAVCANTPGSYICKCRPGFIGNGYQCDPEITCNDAGCDTNALCEMVEGRPKCSCNIGYKGDGFYCTPDYQPESCNTAQDCSPYAACVATSGGYRCRCIQGYYGDGYLCTFDNTYQGPGQYEHDYGVTAPPPIKEELDIYGGDQNGQEISTPECVGEVCWCPEGYTYDRFSNSCHDESTFEVKVEFGLPKPLCDEIKCSCPEGFVYNALYLECDPIDRASHQNPEPFCYDIEDCLCPFGYGYERPTNSCLLSTNAHDMYDYDPSEITSSCEIVNNCDSNALCTYDAGIGESKCICNVGFTGDGFTCSAIAEISCSQVDICHIDAECVYDDVQLKSVCVCKPGFMGDGFICTPQDECSSIEDCDINAQCLFDGRTQRFTCQCNSLFKGDGFTCTEIEDACPLRDSCSPDAECYFDTYASKYRCQCLPGFEGDGITCQKAEIGCNIINNCDHNAECAFDSGAGGYRCRCLPGYEGDGSICNPAYSCSEDRSLCDPMAECELNPVLNSYVCVCRPGFTGDGTFCGEQQTFEKDLLLISRGLSVLRMPIDSNSGPGAPIYVDPFMTAVGADIDCIKGRFYWTDIDSKSIRSSNYDGSEKKPFITVGDIGFPEDVAVDWVARNIFWTDSTNDVVAVATMDSGNKKTVIKGDLVNPRGIAVHPGLGLIFWSDWNRLDPKIESAGMDGTNRRKLVSGAENILLPNSLVVDYETGMVCWADAGTHKIECVGVDGYGRNRVIAKNIEYPFGLTLHYRSFYYTDWTDKRVHEINKYTGEEMSVRIPPLGGSGKVYGIVAAPETCPPVSNICQSNRGNCDDSKICLPNGRGGRSCACTDTDEENGTCPTPYN